ncbi:hypothetical protein C1H46_016940 [Malus baccata]|uniref:Uncharacterized protein n=1 Tax=Malus baccata TaxID=106549 RepID=A0A540MF51_MALBA|nr:hypothetical protein C1H46_016940 [Malus baccata]
MGWRVLVTGCLVDPFIDRQIVGEDVGGKWRPTTTRFGDGFHGEVVTPTCPKPKPCSSS